MAVYHKPVLLNESIDGLCIRPDGTYVDVTFGGGGHSGAILERLTTGRLFAFDQDADALPNVPVDDRFVFIPFNFRLLQDALHARGVDSVDGVLADLGVSSHQFDEADRGFSFRFDAELDMRMDRNQSLTARDVVNYYPEEVLSRILKTYGELPNHRRVASAIVQARTERAIDTTGQLIESVGRMVPPAAEKTFQAKLFQALRIEVNDELAALRELLLQAASIIRTGGRLVVISYHSLEDRLVKDFIRSGNFEGEVNRDFFGNQTGISFKPLNRKPITASADEQIENPRSRSAKMRIAERT
ncbi:MAG: rRNA ((1402)-N(4))-methyltransferase RsmH [Bacteroidota bacterium]